MDAQNAAESDQTRPTGAPSPQQLPGCEPDRKAKPATHLEPSSSHTDQRPNANDAAAAEDALLTLRPGGDVLGDRDSDAETIVLPGKDDHSPSKARKVRQEDKSESDCEPDRSTLKPKPDGVEQKSAPAHGSAPGSNPGNGAAKKRVVASGSFDKDRRPRNKEGGSSGLSSAPDSPIPNPPQQQQPQPQQQQQQQDQPNAHQYFQHHHRRRSDPGSSSQSDSGQHSHHKYSSSKALLRDKLKSADRLLPHKRKAPKADSDDEADSRKPQRQRTTSVNLDGPRPHKEIRSTPAKPHDYRGRSISPPSRQHRRSISTQLPSQSSNGLNFKKKRLPPPLQSTDYHSDESSAGGSPYPRSSKLRSLTTPVTADSMSPAKMAPHKKHLDAHGQTLLARACARGEYETAKQRLGERPEDLNVADYAGNTPLQIAAINGCEDIVKLLIEGGCNLDCVNYDKDTPLLDAVDNGHLGVVRLLLNAGVNPRKANVNGEEPLDRVSEDTDNADDIRAALMAARKRAGERRRTSEDQNSHHDYHDSHAPDSPRRSPTAFASASTGRRSGNVRSTKTRNDLLYMPLDDKTLRQAAGRGDEETVARILQVKEGYDDPESMVAAARGGHDLVIQLLLGLGGANADPGPAPSLPSEFATPVLAAIGQENIKVLELLLEQQGFDPTRRFKGETYYEIARRRQGTNWKEEEQMLKNTYDEYKRSHKEQKEAIKTKSPGGRRERERDREDKLARREESKELSRIHKRNHSSPSLESEARKKGNASKISSPREKKRADSLVTRVEDESHKRATGRTKKDASLASDREVSPATPFKPQKTKRTESDVAGMSSDGETAKPRRKLVSKGELSRERDRQKRAVKEPASPRDSRNDEAPDKSKLSEKYHDRTKALKRNESRDHSSGEGPTKRHRSSMTPDRPSDGDKDQVEGPVKRRRLDSENHAERRSNRPVSVEGRPRKSVSSRDASAKPSTIGSRKEREDGPRDGHDQRGPLHHGPGRINSSGVDKSIHVKSEDVDVPMLDIDRPEGGDKPNASRIESDENELAKKKEMADQEAKKEEERKRLEVEEKKRKLEEEEARRSEEEERARKAEEERKKRDEEESRQRQERADRERREAEEAARLEEERKRLEEEKRIQEVEERKRREEEEEERLRQEQAQREAAAEEARRLREEEERKDRERRERAHREEVERKRAAREAEQRRIHEEQERVRLDKLPPLLRWLDTCANPKTTAVAEKFRRMLGARYDTICQEANGTPAGREPWVLNTHVALLLGEKDLGLARCKAAATPNCCRRRD